MNVKHLLRFFLLGLGMLLSPHLYAQLTTISGRVISSDDKQPLIGVSLNVKGTDRGTQTDVDGKFVLQASVGDLLVVRYLGFEPRTVPVESATAPMEVTLESATAKLQEVVVVGYGTQSRATLSGAVSTVDEQVLKSAPRTNVATALQGTVTGLRVQQTTGQPGATPNITFRGGTSFSGQGSPLVIVDGVIFPSLYGINSEDIETINVLKDAASTAIYGARAANGVILITTKKGIKGRSQVTYSLKHAQNYVRRNSIDYMSAADYILWNRRGLGSRYEAALADGNTAEANNTRNQLTGSWGWALSPAWTSPSGKYSTQLVTDNNRQLLRDPRWNLLVDRNPFNPGQTDSILYLSTSQKELEDMILQESTLQEHYLNFSGGGDKGTFSLGLGTVKDVGIVLGSSLKRYNLNFNGDLDVNEDFKVSLSLSAYNDKNAPSYLTADGDGGLTGGLIQRFGGIAPTARFIHDETGEILPGVDGGTLGNPQYLRDKFINKNEEQRYSGSLNLKYSILPTLKLLASASGFMRYSTRESFTKAYQNGTGGAVVSTRNASFSLPQANQHSYNAFLQYDNTFGKHTVSLLGGGEFFEGRFSQYSAAARGASTDFIPYLSASTEAVGIPYSGFYSWNRLVSGIGRVTYDYDARYLLNVNLRYDGTSRLADNRYGLFPGISAGWNLHNETFFSNSFLSDYITTIKPRVSWGQNGSIDPLDDFATAATYGGTGIYGGNAGFAPNFLVNTALKWERASSLNFGLDLGLLDNRIAFIGDYFIRDIYDKITSLDIPSWTGYGSFTTNLGQLQNRGVELEVRASVIRPTNPGGFSWDVSANFFHVKNYAKELPDNGLENNRQGATQVYDPASGKLVYVAGLQEGKRIGLDEIWAPIYDGLYLTDAELETDTDLYNEYLPYRDKTVKLLGDARWRDLDQNDTIDFRDRVFVGRTIPTVQGGFSTNFGWKGFTLYSQLDFALGHMVLNQAKLRGLSQVQGSQNGPVDVTNTWHPDNPNGTLPRYYWANYGRNYFQDAGGRTNSFANFYEKGDYLALREITLGYQIPQAFLQNVLRDKIKGLRLHVTGTNLVYFTGYSGTFPEVGGNDVGRFPLPRTVTTGLNVTL
ncbi:SusC/RagA family TonB-linked outer membrane protein [Pontibacter sp. E15-1]|uniref:SusC/RagA family TonB-linked outer membrane protein n=1 Tax=Pontibacter sp. E15-1 TaxID=2919918 RepID=UPI001F4F5F2A|nr:SusC/RagA family TonB-linked outer membrane protein [Pontibacter sp. E15-1]MCJ8165689.1 SusC/RagA family TonB-linked outer membrane protein [Pontibacter sp. E15-1]